jgi:hypothetical protein
MVASLRGRELGDRNVHCWKTLPSSAVKTVTEDISICAIVIRKV